MMPPVSQYRQPSYTSTRSDQPPAAGTAPAKLSSSTNLSSSFDPSQLSAPRISSAYSRTIQSHGSTQSGSIDLDTFDVPCPPAMLMTSTAAAASPRVDEYGSKRKSSCSSSSAAATSNLPDLGVVDLSDGKNKERPQRFKAVIHFKRKDHAGKKGNGIENASTTATAGSGFRRSSDFNDESP